MCGAYVTVSDEEILAGIAVLGRQAAVFAEPAGAAAYAGLNAPNLTIPASNRILNVSRATDLLGGELKNDFEETVFKEYLEIKNIKDKLYTAGAIYASMSGSGSTVYGIFEKGKKVNPGFPSSYFVKELTG